MAIPPNDKNPEKHFKKISELNKQFNFGHLSIGMSNDYMQAIKYGASHVRIGSAIFGSRNQIILKKVFLLIIDNKYCKSFFDSAIQPNVGV